MMRRQRRDNAAGEQQVVGDLWHCSGFWSARGLDGRGFGLGRTDRDANACGGSNRALHDLDDALEARGSRTAITGCSSERGGDEPYEGEQGQYSGVTHSAQFSSFWPGFRPSRS
jgi:hypothetical protein